jgi:hypothetical protein
MGEDKKVKWTPPTGEQSSEGKVKWTPPSNSVSKDGDIAEQETVKKKEQSGQESKPLSKESDSEAPSTSIKFIPPPEQIIQGLGDEIYEGKKRLNEGYQSIIDPDKELAKDIAYEQLPMLPGRELAAGYVAKNVVDKKEHSFKDVDDFRKTLSETYLKDLQRGIAADEEYQGAYESAYDGLEEYAEKQKAVMESRINQGEDPERVVAEITKDLKSKYDKAYKKFITDPRMFTAQSRVEKRLIKEYSKYTKTLDKYEDIEELEGLSWDQSLGRSANNSWITASKWPAQMAAVMAANESYIESAIPNFTTVSKAILAPHTLINDMFLSPILNNEGEFANPFLNNEGEFVNPLSSEQRQRYRSDVIKASNKFIEDQDKKNKITKGMLDAENPADFAVAAVGSGLELATQMTGAYVTRGASMFAQESWPIIQRDIENKAKELGVSTDDVIENTLYNVIVADAVGLFNTGLEYGKVRGVKSAFVGKQGIKKVFKEISSGAKDKAKEATPLWKSVIENMGQEMAQGAVTEVGESMTDGDSFLNSLDKGIEYLQKNQALEEGLSAAVPVFGAKGAGVSYRKYNNFREQKNEIKLSKEADRIIEDIALEFGDVASFDSEIYNKAVDSKNISDKAKERRKKSGEAVQKAKEQALSFNDQMSDEHLNKVIPTLVKNQMINERLEKLNKLPDGEVVQKARERAEAEITQNEVDVNNILDKSLNDRVKKEKAEMEEADRVAQEAKRKAKEEEEAEEVRKEQEEKEYMEKAMSPKNINGKRAIYSDGKGGGTRGGVVSLVTMPDGKVYFAHTGKPTGEDSTQDVVETQTDKGGKQVTVKKREGVPEVEENKGSEGGVVYTTAKTDKIPTKTKVESQKVIWEVDDFLKKAKVNLDSKTGKPTSLTYTMPSGGQITVKGVFKDIPSQQETKTPKKTTEKAKAQNLDMTPDMEEYNPNRAAQVKRVKKKLQKGEFGSDKEGVKLFERLLDTDVSTVKDEGAYYGLIERMDEGDISINEATFLAEKAIKGAELKKKPETKSKHDVYVGGAKYTVTETEDGFSVVNENGNEVTDERIKSDAIEEYTDQITPNRDTEESNKEVRSLIEEAKEKLPKAGEKDSRAIYKDFMLSIGKVSDEILNKLTDREMSKFTQGLNDMLDGNATSNFFSVARRIKELSYTDALKKATEGREFNSLLRDKFGVNFSPIEGAKFGFRALSTTNQIYNWMRNSPLEKVDYVMKGDKKGLDILNKILEDTFMGAGKDQVYMTDWINDAQKIVDNLDKAFKGKASDVRMLLSMYVVDKAYQIEKQKKEGKGVGVENTSVKDIIERNKGFVEKPSAEKRHVNRTKEMERVYNEVKGDVVGAVESMLEDKKYSSKQKKAMKDMLSVVEGMSDPKGKFRAMMDSVAAILGKRISFQDFYIHNMVEKPNDTPLTDSGNLIGVMDFDIDTSMGSVKSAEGQTKAKIKHNHFTDFDIVTSAMKAQAKMSRTYHMNMPVTALDKALNPNKYQDRSSRAFAEGLKKALHESIKGAYLRRPDQSLLSKIEKIGYQAQLAGVSRAMNELMSNMIHAAIFKPKEASEGIKILNDMGVDTAMDILLNVNYMIGGTQGSRLAQREKGSVHMERGIIEDIRESGLKDSAYTMKQIRRFAKKPQEFSSAIISLPDRMVAVPVWMGTFAMEFKKESGKNFDWSVFEQGKLQGDQMTEAREYTQKHENAIKRARRKADDVLTQGFATMNPLSGISASKVNVDDNWHERYDKFMTRFRRHEFFSAVEAIEGMRKTGHLTQKEGAALLAATVVRMMAYQLMYRSLQALMYMGTSGLISMMGGDMPGVDEDDFEIDGGDVTRSFLGSVLTLGALRRMGNLKGTVLSGLVEAGNMGLMEGILYDGEFNSFDNSLLMSALNWSDISKDYKKFDQKVFATLLRMTGAYRPTLQALVKAGEGAERTITGAKKKTRDKGERQLIANLIRLAVYMGGVPPQKDINYALNQWTYQDVISQRNYEKEIENGTQEEEESSDTMINVR